MSSLITRLLQLNSGIWFFFAALLGILVPWSCPFPNWALVVLLEILIFVALFKLDLSELNLALFQDTLVFCLWRFILLPSLIWIFFHFSYPRIAVAALILSAMPSATASPSICLLLGGRVAHAMAVLFVSSIMCIFSIPAFGVLFAHNQIRVSAQSLLFTLVAIFLIPSFLFFVSRNKKSFTTAVSAYGKSVTFISLLLCTFLAVWQQQDIMKSSIQTSSILLLCLVALYFAYFLFGTILPLSKPKEIGRTLSLCAVFNNNGLVISIGALYMPEFLAFFVLSELPWCLAFWVAEKKILRQDHMPME